MCQHASPKHSEDVRTWLPATRVEVQAWHESFFVNRLHSSANHSRVSRPKACTLRPSPLPAKSPPHYVMFAQLLRERMHAEEIARIDDTDSLRRDLAIQKEASESRLRLWAEDRLQKERTAVEEALQRTQAHSGIVRALLDEASRTP